MSDEQRCYQAYHSGQALGRHWLSDADALYWLELGYSLTPVPYDQTGQLNRNLAELKRDPSQRRIRLFAGWLKYTDPGGIARKIFFGTFSSTTKLYTEAFLLAKGHGIAVFSVSHTECILNEAISEEDLDIP